MPAPYWTNDDQYSPAYVRQCQVDDECYRRYAIARFYATIATVTPGKDAAKETADNPQKEQ